MKKKSYVFFASIIVLLAINTIFINQKQEGCCVFNPFSIAIANAESGGEGYHERVIGCGSKDMSDWEAGCCAGMTSPCTDNCTETEYCD